MEMPNLLYKTAQVESLQQTAMLNQQPAVLHRSPALHNGDKCRTAPEQTPHRNPEEGSASEPAEHNLCAAVLNSGKLLEPPRFLLQHPRPACSLPPPPPRGPYRGPAQAGEPPQRVGLGHGSQWVHVPCCGAEVCSGKLSVSVSVSSSRRGGTVTCTAVSEPGRLSAHTSRCAPAPEAGGWR